MGWGCNSGQQPEDITFSIISLSANQKLVQHLPEKEFSSTLMGLESMGREFSHKILGMQLSVSLMRLATSSLQGRLFLLKLHRLLLAVFSPILFLKQHISPEMNLPSGKTKAFLKQNQPNKKKQSFPPTVGFSSKVFYNPFPSSLSACIFPPFYPL